MKTQREDQKNDGPAKIQSGHRQQIAEFGEGQCGRVQEQAHIGGVDNQQATEQAQANGQKIEPARDFRGVANRFRAVHRGNRFRKHRVEKVRSAEAPEPQAVGTVHVGAHQIGAS